MDTGLIHRLAVICKDYYVLRTIDDLFIYAGVRPDWYLQPLSEEGGMRIGRFYGWVQGIQHHAPDQLDRVLTKVAREIIRNTSVSEQDRQAIEDGLKPDAGKPQQAEINLDPLLSTLARALATNGLNRELAVLVSAEATIDEREDDFGETGDVLELAIPFALFSQIKDEQWECQRAIHEQLQPLARSIELSLWGVDITPKLVRDDQWRDKALAWLTGEKVTNQGRIRSDNVAPRTADGLLFRSQPEIFLYQALKSLGVSFAPLPVFIRGGEEYRRIEPDFVIIKDGVLFVVEVDGDTYHRETPAEAYNRTTMLAYEGAHIERVNASQCDTFEKATACAERLLTVIARLKNSRR